ncbi:thioesterase domain-containing protein [Mucilaginibacter sp. SMC90]|uniref:thioesterase II family protein n=1 Tax=Mucilaginibacter sp. SMC90 TaxID=2929803 RepID=UPI001FB1AC23|nr:thioesterase domain-containing protein [Mucilaginibacter sp. SMC90]UOE51894.1 thioesterase domain-containing protein [Mucilaginibacter sp. SMC90]
MSEKINLICLPFAGGNRYSYRPLFTETSAIFNVVTLEYPGRGTRIFEELTADINKLVNDLFNQLKPILSKGDYALYGHSLGGLLTYLLAVKIRENNYKLPLYLFITGTSGPSAPSRLTKKFHLYPHKEFIDEVIILGGMPDEILQDSAMMEFLEPIIRNDFKVSETYVHQAAEPLNIPFTVITGTDEDLTAEEVLLWQNESIEAVDFIQLQGDHFFIMQHKDFIINAIAEKLKNN